MPQRLLAASTLVCLVATQMSCITAVGIFQPRELAGPTLVIETRDANGEPWERVLSPIELDEKLFVASNHWTRTWYRQALANPHVRVTRDGETGDYRAIPASEDERERIFEESGFSPVFYVFTGFAPRKFLRLEPR